MTSSKHLVDGKYSIKDLVDLKKLQRIFQHFTDTMDFTIGFLNVPDMEILAATGWRKICTNFHRRCPKSAENCRKSNARLVRQMTKPGRIVIEQCANGLVDCAMPVFIKGKCVAILATGQVLLRPPNVPRFQKQAKSFGLNEKKYMAALKEVPVLSAKRLQEVTGFLKELASLVAELGYASLKEKEKNEQLALDLRERKMAEKSLREIAGQLKTLQEATTDGVLVADIRTGRIVKANARACLMFGYSAKEFLKKKFTELHPPQYVLKAKALFKFQAQRKKTLGSDVPCRRKNGCVFYADIASRPLTFQGGPCLNGFFRDVTERKLTEERERESSRRLQAVFDSTFQFIALLKPEGKVLEVNQSALKFGGLTSRDVRDKFFWNCRWWTISRKTQRELRLAVAQAARGKFIRYPVEVLGKKGVTIMIDFSLKPVRNEKGRVILLTAEGRDITERKKAEEILRNEHAITNAIFDALPGTAYLFGEDGKFIRWNKNYEKIFGWTDEDMSRISALDTVAPYDRERMMREMTTMMRTGKSSSLVLDTLTKDGRSVPQLCTGVVADFYGKRCVVGMAHDVSERIKAEKALLESEERLRKILKQAPIAIAIVSLDGVIEFINQKAVEIFGYLPEDIPTMDRWWAQAYPDRAYRRKTIHDWTGRVKRALATGSEIQGAEYRVTCKDRTVKTIFISGAGISDKVFVLFEDITSRKRAEDQLMQREAYLTSIIDNQSGMVWLKDTASRFLAVNQVFAKMAGKKRPEDVVGKADLDFWPLKLADGYRADDRKVMRTGKHVTVEELISEKGVARWHETFKAPVFDADGKVIGTTGYARDITDRKRAEEALRESEEKFRAMFETSVSGMALCEMDGTLVQVNQAYLDMIGYTRKEALQLTYWDLTPKDYAKDEAKQLRSMERTGTYGPYEKEYIHKTRGRIPVLLNGAIVVGADGKKRIWSVVMDITERKRAEEKLLFISKAVESINVAIGLADAEGRHFYQNKALTDLFGYASAKELEAAGGARKVVRDPKVAREMFGAIMGGKSWAGELEMVTKSGRVFPAFERAGAVKDSKGKIIGLIEIISDITDRKRAEGALRDSEQSLKESQTIAGLGNYALDLRSGLWTSSPVLDEIFGIGRKYKRTEKGWLALVHPAWRERMEHYLRDEVIGKRGRFDQEYKILRHWDGKERWVHGLGELKLDDQGHPVQMIGTVMDITDRKKADDAIREHRRQLLQIIDVVPHMIFAKDKNGKILLANRAVGDMYGKKPRELIGARRRDVHPVPEEVEAYLSVDREVLETGNPKVVPDEIFTDISGRKHVLQTIKIPFQMVGIEEACILGVSVDVTEQKKVEEFRNDIVRTVSHELRTPLSIEKEGISLLVDEVVGPVNPEQKEILQTVMRSIDRLARMISSLLDISSIETGKIKLLQKKSDLTDLVKDVAFEFKKRAAEKGIELSVKLPGPAVPVLADPDKITQVLTNLVDNALKFTAKGSVEISVSLLKDEAECTVRDTGIGIAAANLGKLFEKFQQFSRTAGPGEKGFGLGLSIAKGIIELHRGRIWAYSEEGRGTAVFFVLPLYDRGIENDRK